MRAIHETYPDLDRLFERIVRAFRKVDADQDEVTIEREELSELLIFALIYRRLWTFGTTFPMIEGGHCALDLDDVKTAAYLLGLPTEQRKVDAMFKDCKPKKHDGLPDGPVIRLDDLCHWILRKLPAVPQPLVHIYSRAAYNRILMVRNRVLILNRFCVTEWISRLWSLDFVRTGHTRSWITCGNNWILNARECTLLRS
jgi:hypothetical protein